MNKDKAIITQVAAKIAADLIIKSEDIEATCADWNLAFSYVNDKLQEATGMSEEANLASAVKAFNAEVSSTPASDRPTVPFKMSGSLQIAGKQHGDLPNWLVSACQKAGVGKVWDNRDTAVGTRRPWFKQADAVEGQEPAAFWPPKGA
jgi:hypothetical protein